jgi:hypothetical protein
MADEFGPSSERPTERANYWYETAEGALNRVAATAWKGDMDIADMIRAQSWALRSQFRGDKDMAVGLRATYILLKQIDQRLQRLEQAQKRP